ncbi:MAG: class A beta-lactamase, partial [Alcaligenaceae bacterium]
AHVLKRVDEGQEKLDRPLSYSADDLLTYAPVTRANVTKKKMSVSELAAAAVQVSDNTAANLLFRTQGGPTGLTQFLRNLGDSITRSDRIEPELNTASGDADTTTPKAMSETLRTLFEKETLQPSSLALLKGWMLTNTTSAHRLKAGLPANWKVADKTGTGGQGNVNDVGIVYTPDGAAIYVAVFISESKKPTDELEAAIADVAREIKRLEKLMLEHARNLEFEQAARVRDQLTRLKDQAFGAHGNDSVAL